MSEGLSVDAEIIHELRIQPGRVELAVEGELHVFERGAAAIVRIVTMHGRRVSETVVSVVDQREFLKLIDFVKLGGRLRLEERLR